MSNLRRRESVLQVGKLLLGHALVLDAGSSKHNWNWTTSLGRLVGEHSHQGHAGGWQVVDTSGLSGMSALANWIECGIRTGIAGRVDVDGSSIVVELSVDVALAHVDGFLGNARWEVALQDGADEGSTLGNTSRNATRNTTGDLEEDKVSNSFGNADLAP